MSHCLIGHSGFVGGNLMRQASFETTFNSKNVDEIRGRAFDTVYCCGVAAAKWIANKKPKEDLQGVVRLLDALRDVEARRFVLISTVDVYREPLDVDETTPVTTAGLHPYGLHRRMVETFVVERFPRHLIVRLPGLFGSGLKKNIIFDYLDGKPTDGVHAEARFQFYSLDRLYVDLQTAMGAGLALVNFGTEPVTVKELVERVFDKSHQHRADAARPRYDMRTRHAEVFGGTGAYIQSKKAVLADIVRFVETHA